MRHDNHLPGMAYNVELAVVIGRAGRYIPVERAMEHVAGYTVVDDVSGTHYYSTVPGNAGTGYSLPRGYQDWLYQATASWGGKKADTLCPMGPYLVTKDEVGDPYNLLMWTRQSGRTRDRAHSGAALLGIERVVAWYSSFASLHVGDVVHFGTMGVDGLPVTPEQIAGGTSLEVEIESVGALANPVVVDAAPGTPRGPCGSSRCASAPGPGRPPSSRPRTGPCPGRGTSGPPSATPPRRTAPTPTACRGWPCRAS
jgi:2-keto-4-pentenoate hydratase/2-oxohepta-3-ene-1,7-dioic acid hydratase in catechol pathway